MRSYTVKGVLIQIADDLVAPIHDDETVLTLVIDGTEWFSGRGRSYQAALERLADVGPRFGLKPNLLKLIKKAKEITTERADLMIEKSDALASQKKECWV